ncbi:MAG: hypothetical protein GC152_02725 [Alphaproteobacteria bacterium]|nr:hypothetical protein [Alphaproteobacteria bacterium]
MVAYSEAFSAALEPTNETDPAKAARSAVVARRLSRFARLIARNLIAGAAISAIFAFAAVTSADQRGAAIVGQEPYLTEQP